MNLNYPKHIRKRRYDPYRYDADPDQRVKVQWVLRGKHGRSSLTSSPGLSAALLENRTHPIVLGPVGWQYQLLMP